MLRLQALGTRDLQGHLFTHAAEKSASEVKACEAATGALRPKQIREANRKSRRAAVDVLRQVVLKPAIEVAREAAQDWNTEVDLRGLADSGRCGGLAQPAGAQVKESEKRFRENFALVVEENSSPRRPDQSDYSRKVQIELACDPFTSLPADPLQFASVFAVSVALYHHWTGMRLAKNPGYLGFIAASKITLGMLRPAEISDAEYFAAE